MRWGGATPRHECIHETNNITILQTVLAKVGMPPRNIAAQRPQERHGAPGTDVVDKRIDAAHQDPTPVTERRAADAFPW